MRDTHLAGIHECINRSLQLFDRSYSSVGHDLGGWYHRLEADVPGPSATAAALHSYLLADRLPARLPEGLAFLTSRQVVSNERHLDGGWAVNTSSGRPVLEATALILRFLGSSQLLAGENTPDLLATYRWIVNNQNPDGGWGSFHGQPSRIWLTAMAIRALATVNINDPAVIAATEWLIRERDPLTSCWGERPRSAATVTHTAFTLTCLVESNIGSRRAHVAEAIRRGFEWLVENINVTSIFDDAARVESYNISYTEDGRAITWQNAIWHPGLPFALSALIMDPRGANLNIVGAIAQTIVSAQLTDGRWPNVDGADGISVWSVWPFVNALGDFAKMTSIRNADR